MRRPPPALPRAESGFTLIEMIVALALFALISLAGLALVQSILGVQRATEGRMERLADMQRAMFVLSADFEQMAGVPGFEPAAIEFRRHGTDGTVLVRYAIADGRLERSFDGRARPLLTGITGAGFRFHLPQGAWLSVPPDPRKGPLPDAIEVTLQVPPTRGMPGGSLRRIIPLPAA